MLPPTSVHYSREPQPVTPTGRTVKASPRHRHLWGCPQRTQTPLAHTVPPRGPSLQTPGSKRHRPVVTNPEPGLQARHPAPAHGSLGQKAGRAGAQPRHARSREAGQKRDDRATTVTSSVWDTCPSAKGSSSAVAGAARMLRTTHAGRSRPLGAHSFNRHRGSTRLCPPCGHGAASETPGSRWQREGDLGTREEVAACPGLSQGDWAQEEGVRVWGS